MKYSIRQSTITEKQQDDMHINSVKEIESPTYIVFYKAKREDVDATGQTESTQPDPDMAKVEALTKLSDLGYIEIEILAVENAGKKAVTAANEYAEECTDIDELFKDFDDANIKHDTK